MSSAARGARAGSDRFDGLVTGRVLSGGVPVAGACVEPVGEPTASGAAAGQALARFVMTRSDGRYVIAGLRPGRYQLRAWRCVPGSSESGSAAVTSSHLMVFAGSVARQDLRLPPRAVPEAIEALGSRVVAAYQHLEASAVASVASVASSSAKPGAITGRVTTKSGSALVGACVEGIGLSLGGLKLHHTKTVAGGVYKLADLSPSLYLVDFYGCGATRRYASTFGGQVTVKAGRTTTGVNGSLELGAELLGVVRDRAGDPIAGACVRAVEGPETTTGTTGSYDLPGITPGPTSVEAWYCGPDPAAHNYAPQLLPGTVNLAGARRFHLASGQVLGNVNATLMPGGTLRGKLVGPGATPVGGLCVQAVNPLFGGLFGWSWNGKSSADGDLELYGLPSSHFILDISTGCGNTGDWLGSARRIATTAGHTKQLGTIAIQPAGAIAGKLTGPGGVALGGACVGAIPANGGALALSVVGFADKDGSYVLHDLKPGNYEVLAEQGCLATPGSKPSSLLEQFYGGVPGGGVGQPVTVTAQAVTGGIDMQLSRGGFVTGTLTGPTGAGVAGACVLGFPSASSVVEISSTIPITGTNGTYTVGPLPTGDDVIEGIPGCVSEKPGGLATGVYGSSDLYSDALPAVSVVQGATVPHIDFALQKLATVTGKVTLPAGATGAPVCLFITAASQTIVAAELRLSATGHYVLQFPPGTLGMGFAGCPGSSANLAPVWFKGSPTATGAKPVVLGPGKTTPDVDATVSVGGRIAGTVSGLPADLFEVEVGALRSDGFSGAAATTSTGSYVMTSLGSGTYAVFAELLNAKTLAVSYLVGPSAVSVTAGDETTGVDMTYSTGGSVTGQVTDSGDPSAVIGLCADVVDAAGISLAEGFTSYDGKYRITDVPAGSYDVYFFPGCGGPWAVEPVWYGGAADQSGATAITVTDGTVTSGVDQTVAADGSITGTVTDSSSQGIAGICVTAVGDVATGVGSLTAETGSSGNYTIEGLPAGSYDVEFTSACGSPTTYVTQWYQDASTQATAVAVAVVAGTATSGISISLST